MKNIGVFDQWLVGDEYSGELYSGRAFAIDFCYPAVSLNLVGLAGFQQQWHPLHALPHGPASQTVIYVVF